MRNVFLHEEIIVSCHYDSWHCPFNTTNYWFEWTVGSYRWESTIRYLYPNCMPKYASECTGGYILKFQNTFDRTCDDIGMGIQTTFPRKPNLDSRLHQVMIPTPRNIRDEEQTENFFGILISTRLQWALTLLNLHHSVFHKSVYELLTFSTFIGTVVIVW